MFGTKVSIVIVSCEIVFNFTLSCYGNVSADYLIMIVSVVFIQVSILRGYMILCGVCVYVYPIQMFVVKKMIVSLSNSNRKFKHPLLFLK